MSSYPILNTKLYKPEVKDHYVFRKEIIENLERHRDKPLTLVVAATGYGKSVTISEWLDYSKTKYCWISLDNDLDDLRTFLEYLTYGIQSIIKDSLPELKKLLEGEELAPSKVIYNTFINELDEIQEELVLILDDYHSVKNQQIHDLINELLKYFPKMFQLVIISRIDPPLKLSTLKSFGQVNEIRMTELSFNQSEMLTLAKNLVGSEIDKELSELLLNKTEGWIIGLTLACMRLNQGKVLQKSLEEIKGDKNFLTDYLLNEVFKQVDVKKQIILLVASCFERFSKDLLKHVMDGHNKNTTNDYHSAIDDLFDQYKTVSLFIIPLDESNEWFRFHHFFKDFLSSLLLNKISREKVKKYYKRGSKYFYSNNLLEEAIYHAVKSDNVSLIVKIFEQNKYTLLDKDQFNLLWKWLSIIPEEVIIAQLHLILTRALLYDTTGDYVSIQNDLNVAKKLLEKNTKTDERKKRLWGEYYAVSSILSYISGNIQEAIDHSENAFKNLSRSQFYFRDIALAYGAFALNSSKNSDKAISLLNNYLDELPADFIFSRMRGMLILTMVYAFLGNLKEIKKLSLLIQPVSYKNKQWVSFSHINYYLSAVNYQWNELDNVVQYIDQVEEHQYAGRPLWILHCLFTKAFTLLAQGNYEEFELTVLKLNTFAQDYGLELGLMMVKTCEVELALRQNKIEKALKISKGVNFELYPPIFFFFFPQLTYIKLLMRLNDKVKLDEAEDRLEKLIQFGRTTCRQNLLIQALPLQSLLYMRRGDEKKMYKIIEESISIAEPGGFIRAFLDLGQPMEKLLISVYKTNPDNTYLKRILNEFKKEKYNTGVEVTIDKTMGIKENLSTREIELLELVAKGFRNREIGDKLNLSTISIKKYLSNIYMKLGVGNRVLAVSKARELRLISKN